MILRNISTWRRTVVCVAMLASVAASARTVRVPLAVDAGAHDCAPAIRAAIDRAVAEHPRRQDDTLRLELAPGVYNLRSGDMREIYVSNHDQPARRAVAIALDNLHNVVLDGRGAELRCHGRMLPIAMTACDNCELTNLTVDFELPHITQVTVSAVDTLAGTMTYRPIDGTRFAVSDGTFTTSGDGWSMVPCAGMVFEPDTRRIVYNTGDINVGVRNCTLNADGTVTAPWRDSRIRPGMVVTMRTWDRPAPAVFVDRCVGTRLTDMRVHYAEGMGLLAQLSTDLTLKGFNVCLRGDDDPRYFTTQADATHFMGCRGRVEVVDGLYENMMDDAVNVHGTYLKLVGRQGSRTVRGRYMHYQSWGMPWGLVGDSVQLIVSETMRPLAMPARIAAIRPYTKEGRTGAFEFDITLDRDLPEDWNPDSTVCGIENLSAHPEVYIARNLVRNNRARGMLVSSPRRTLIEDNLFDHTSGTAILLCGDCNGWFESGSCRDVTIRRNTFVNALTSNYQFTEAVISVWPVIHAKADGIDLANTDFHSGLTVEDNVFETFDPALLYARSLTGLRWRNNRIVRNKAYRPLHPEGQTVQLIDCTDCAVED